MGLECARRQVDVNGLFLFIRLRRVDTGITAEYPFVSIVGNEMQSAYQLIQRVISVTEDLGEGAHFHLRFRSAGHFVFGKRKIVKFPGAYSRLLSRTTRSGCSPVFRFQTSQACAGYRSFSTTVPSPTGSRSTCISLCRVSAFTQRTPRKSVSSKMKTGKRIGRTKNIKFRSVIF